MKKRMGVTLLLLGQLALAQTGQTIEKLTLSNGMNVILNPDSTSPKVVFHMLVKVGSKDEPEGRSGFAHLFEHLMFMGTKRVPQGMYDQLLEGFGGENNASTAPDFTMYYSTAPTENLEQLLWIESDRLEALGENIDQKKLDLQREVVLNERRQRTENTPYGEAYVGIDTFLYPLGHPYQRGTIGSPEDLNAATLEDVKTFFSTYYVPNNISILLTGRFDAKTVKPLLEKYFGTLVRKNDVIRKPVPTESSPTRRVTFTDEVSVPEVLLSWRLPAAASKDSLSLQVFIEALDKHLTETLVDTGEISGLWTGYLPGALESQLTLEIVPAEDVSLADTEKKVLAAIQNKLKTGLSDAELAGLNTQNEVAVYKNWQDPLNKAEAMHLGQFYFNDPEHDLKVIQQRAKLKATEVSQAVRPYFSKGVDLTQTVLPRNKTPEANPRDTKPGVSQAAPIKAPAVTEFKLSNGLSVHYWQVGNLPTTSLNFVFNSGTMGDPAGKEGTTSVLMGLLDRTSRELKLDTLGATLTPALRGNTTSVQVDALNRNLPQTLKTLTSVFTRPQQAESLKNQIAVAQSQLSQTLDDPSGIASFVMAQQYYGTHPLGRVTTQKSLGSITLKDVQTLANGLLTPNGAHLFAAGSLTAGAFKAQLENNLKNWTGKASQLSAVPAVQAPTNKLFIVDRPGAEQTLIQYHLPSSSYQDPRFLQARTLAITLGGTFTSRLNQNLREDKGYTYGASALQDLHRNYGIFQVNTAVTSEVTHESLVEILRELKNAQQGITAEELNKSTLAVQSGVLEALSQPSALVGAAGRAYAENRQISDLVSEMTKYRQLTLADVNEQAKVPLTGGVWVLVGDKGTILKALEGLDLPAPQEITLEK